MFYNPVIVFTFLPWVKVLDPFSIAFEKASELKQEIYREINKWCFIKGIYSSGRCSWSRVLRNMLFIGFNNSKIRGTWSYLPQNVGWRTLLLEPCFRLLTCSWFGAHYLCAHPDLIYRCQMMGNLGQLFHKLNILTVKSVLIFWGEFWDIHFPPARCHCGEGKSTLPLMQDVNM